MRWKSLAHRVPPFEVTQDHRNRHGSLDYLWVPIGDFASVSYNAETNGYIGRNAQNFHPVHLTPTLRGFPRNLLTAVGVKKNYGDALTIVNKFVNARQ